MDYNTFLLKIENFLKDYYPHAEIKFNKITKNNGVVLDGVSILEHTSNINETIYLNRYYDAYTKGIHDLEEIEQSIVLLHEKSVIPENIDFSFFRDFTEVKKSISFKLINLMMNKELLKEVPHIIYLDFAIVFYCMFNDDRIGKGTILIRNSHLEDWNISVQELYEIALKNSPSILPSTLIGMDDYLKKLNVRRNLPFEEDVPDTSPELCNMYILTNDDKYYGASVLMYDNLLSDLSDRFLSSFFVIPSSIHEVILLPTNNKSNIDDFNLMVRSVNDQALDREDILSDHAYYYDREDRALYAS